MKRYQVYLNAQSVNILDEVTEISTISRSKLIQTAIDGAASRIGNLLAAVKPPKAQDYSVWDKMAGSIKIPSKKIVNFSQRDDDLYYR